MSTIYVVLMLVQRLSDSVSLPRLLPFRPCCYAIVVVPSVIHQSTGAARGLANGFHITMWTRGTPTRTTVWYRRGACSGCRCTGRTGRPAQGVMKEIKEAVVGRLLCYAGRRRAATDSRRTARACCTAGSAGARRSERCHLDASRAEEEEDAAEARAPLLVLQQITARRTDFL